MARIDILVETFGFGIAIGMVDVTDDMGAPQPDALALLGITNFIGPKGWAFQHPVSPGSITAGGGGSLLEGWNGKACVRVTGTRIPYLVHYEVVEFDTSIPGEISRTPFNQQMGSGTWNFTDPLSTPGVNIVTTIEHCYYSSAWL